jgi:hypothetical protein
MGVSATPDCYKWRRAATLRKLPTISLLFYPGRANRWRSATGSKSKLGFVRLPVFNNRILCRCIMVAEAGTEQSVLGL